MLEVAVTHDSVTVLGLDPGLPVFYGAGHVRMIQMCEALSRLGHRVVYVAAELDDDPLRHARMLPSLGIEVRVLRGRAGGTLTRWDIAPRLTAILREFEPQIVVVAYFHLAHLVLGVIRSGVPAARFWIDTVDLHFVRVAAEAAVTQDPTMERKARRLRAAELAIYPQADGIIASSESDRRILLQELPDMVALTVPVLFDDQEAFNHRYEKRNGVVFVGTSMHRPNVDAVKYWQERIWPYLAQPQWELAVAGHDPTNQYASLPPEGISVLGTVPDTAAVLAGAWLSVAPLRWGAGSNGKVIESLLAGTPVIATPIAVQGLCPAVAGVLHVASSPEELAAAVRHAVADRSGWETRSVMGRHLARAHHGRGAAERMMQKLIDLSA